MRCQRQSLPWRLSISWNRAFRPNLLRNRHRHDGVVVSAGGGRGGAVGLADECLAFLQQARTVEQAWLGGELGCEVSQHRSAISGGGEPTELAVFLVKAVRG